MTLFLTLLPLYLFGNLHCLGMCGPLVFLIGQHRFRSLYFVGRILSFTLAGGLAGEMGAVLHVLLKRHHLAEFISFIFGFIILFIGLASLFKYQAQLPKIFLKPFSKINAILSTMLLKDRAIPTFLFGFFTVALPCGQTLVVFSACALAANLFVGLLNGFALALLTTPALLFSMQTFSLVKRFKGYHKTILGLSSITIGTLTICRGLAEVGFISHWILNPQSSNFFHIVIF